MRIPDLSNITPTGFWKSQSALPGQWDGSGSAPSPEWLVKGMIMRTGIGMLSGVWGSGKTYVAIDLSLSVATGTPFAGRKVKERAGVVYISPERPQSILRRAKVARQQREINDVLPLYRAWSCPTLTEADAAEKLIEALYQIDDEMVRRHGVNVGLVIIDTLVVAAGWENESDNSEVQYVNKVLRSVSQQTGAFVLAIDHHGKDPSRGTRGASDKEASMDVVIHLAPGAMTLKKCSEGLQGLKTAFRLPVHELGKDEDGDPITECTVEWDDETHMVAGAVLSRSADIALQAFRAAIAEVDDDHVPEHVWRKHAYEMGITKSDKERARRAAFQRSRDTLVNSGEIEFDGKEYRLKTAGGT